MYAPRNNWTLGRSGDSLCEDSPPSHFQSHERKKGVPTSSVVRYGWSNVKMCRQISEKFTITKFRGNPFSSSQVVTRLQTDRLMWTDVSCQRLLSRATDFFLRSPNKLGIWMSVCSPTSHRQQELSPAALSVRTCLLPPSSGRLTHRPINRGSKHLWNVGKRVQVYAGQNLIR
jgi:hypothetical protein